MSNDDDLERRPLLGVREDDAAAEMTASREEPRTMPWAGLGTIYFVNLVPGMAFLMISPFVNQMLLENGVVKKPEDAGYYSGFIESLFAVVQILLIVPIAHATDKFGRKPVICYGTFVVAVSTACFGISKTFPGMLFSRSLAAGLGGAWAAMRVMLDEMVPRGQHATAFGGLAISYRVGQIIGLPLGGWLAHPERHVGLSGPFWHQYPFALPCFVGAGFAVLATTVGSLALKETSEQSTQPAILDAPNTTATPNTPPVTYASVMSRRSFHLLVGCFMIRAMGELVYPLLPLWAFTPLPSGGLEMDEAKIGALLSMRATMQIIGLCFMPFLHRRLGSALLYRLSGSTYLLIIPLFPAANYLARLHSDPNHPSVWVTLLILFSAWSLTSLTWPCISIMINASSPSPQALTRLNALSQLGIVVPQVLAPGVATSLFAYSLQTKFLDGNLIWAALFLCACAFTAHAWFFIHEDENKIASGPQTST